jgi:hypothetical protein
MIRQTLEKGLAGLLISPLIDLVWDYYNDPNTIFLFLEPNQVKQINESKFAIFLRIKNDTATLNLVDRRIICKAVGFVEFSCIKGGSFNCNEYRYRKESNKWHPVR